MTGELNVTHNGGITGSTAPSYGNANIELQTSSNHAPAISFHRGGYSATTLYEYDGELYTNAWVARAQTGKLVSSGNIGTYAWTSSNDGSGSGLDADLLDGQHGSYYAPASHVHTFDSLTSKTGGTGTYQTSGDFRAPIFYDSNNTGYYVDPASTSNFSRLNVDSLGGHVNAAYFDIEVNGDANTYYPVSISSAGAFGFQMYSVSRGYNWLAPTTWNTASHRGGLTFSFQWPGDGAWGGNDKTMRITEFNETYTTMVAGMQLSTGGGGTHSGPVIWLRGGGAQYRIHHPAGVEGSANIHLTSVTASNGTVYAPRSDTSNNTSEIYGRYPVRGTTALHVGSFAVLHEGDDQTKAGYLQSNASIRAPLFYDSNNTGYYTDPNGTSRMANVAADKLYLSASADNKIGFWNGTTSYTIGMSQATDATNGGRVAGETTSDYNMYFTMSAGTNRGFVFRNNNSSGGVVAGIDAAGNGRFTGTVTAPTFNATSTVSGGFQGIDADTITAPSFTWTSDLNTGMWHAGADAIGFTTGGVNRITINSAGISGVGTGLTELSGSNITTGTVAAARVATLNQNTTGSSGSCTGNSATATALQTARTINGVSFNGSANITVEPYIEDDEGTDATRLLVFTDNTTAGYKRLNEDSGLTYNPLNNLLRSNSMNASNFYVGTATTGAGYITSPFALGNLGLNAGSTAYDVTIGSGATNYAKYNNTLITYYKRLYSAPGTSETASTPNFESRAQGSGNGVPQYHMSFTNSTGAVNGRITTNNFGTTYATTSDYRVKEDLQEMEDATSRLLQLKPINFKWVGSEDRTDGFLAHEVKEIVHDAVVGEKDATETVVEIVVDEEGNETEVTKVVDSLQALDQAKLVPLLVKTIQELEARIVALENA